MASATGPQWNGYWKIPQAEIEIKERIGESVQARNVFRAFWKTRDNLPVAAKSIDFFSDREARVLASVRHENVVQMYGAIVEPPLFIIVMEICDEGSLYDYVRNLDNPLTKKLQQQWAMEIAKAMRYLHFEALYKPIAHRSLTPTSVVLAAKDGSRLVAKLCAFGYSKPTMNQPSPFTRGSFEHSVWKAPEVLRQERPTMESDVYGFAMILWYLAARKTEPFLPLQKERAFMAIVDGKRPVIPSDCPEHWPAVMEAGWKDKKEDRADFNDIVRMLEGQATKGSSVEVAKQEAKPTELKVWEIPSEDIDYMTDEESLGENGKFSCVLKATYIGNKLTEHHDKIVAAKQIERDSVTITSVSRFIESTLTVSDKTLVRVLGAQCNPLPAHIIMEMMGTSLKKRLDEKGAFRTQHVKIVAKGIAAGLAYLHNLPTPRPHGGLSSSNVLLNIVSRNPSTWEIKLADYFLTELIPSGSVSGERYAAPELKTKKTPTLKSDIYSFGILLVEMYTNTVPQNPSSLREELNEIDNNNLVQLIKQCTDKLEANRPSIAVVDSKLDDL